MLLVDVKYFSFGLPEIQNIKIKRSNINKINLILVLLTFKVFDRFKMYDFILYDLCMYKVEIQILIFSNDNFGNCSEKTMKCDANYCVVSLP